MPDSSATPNEAAPVNEEITKVLEDLRTAAEKLNKPAEEPRTAPPIPDRRATLQKSLGYSDEQMAAHEEMIMRAQAPVIENTAWTKLEKKPDVETYRKEIEAELSLYPQERRTPDLLEKVYFYVRGKHADSKPAAGAPKGGAPTTRVSSGPGYSGADPGLSAGGGSGAPESEELDDREKFVADKLGVDYKGYAASKKAGKEIRELRVPDSRPVNSLADVELRRMTGKR